MSFNHGGCSSGCLDHRSWLKLVSWFGLKTYIQFCCFSFNLDIWLGDKIYYLQNFSCQHMFTWLKFLESFFVWTVALGKILILDNLRNRHVIVLDQCLYVQEKRGDHRSSFFFIVMWLENCGFRFFIFLGQSGSCLKGWCSCLLAGEVNWEAVAFQKLGGWLPCAQCSAFEEN